MVKVIKGYDEYAISSIYSKRFPVKFQGFRVRGLGFRVQG
jgi:hypothetical protein